MVSVLGSQRAFAEGQSRVPLKAFCQLHMSRSVGTAMSPCPSHGCSSGVAAGQQDSALPAVLAGLVGWSVPCSLAPAPAQPHSFALSFCFNAFVPLSHSVPDK